MNPCAALFAEQFIILSNKTIEPGGGGGNLFKDQAILDIKQCYLNINYVRQFFLVQTRRSNIWLEQTNTKQRIWKTVVAIKNENFPVKLVAV